MADHDSDTPQDPPRTTPDPHRDEPTPAPDAHTRPEAQGEVRPDQQEELGPIEGLMHASAAQVTAEVTGDEEAEAEAEQLGAEGEGVETAQIFSIMVATAVTLALAVFGVFFLVADFSDEKRVEREAVTLYPELREVENVAAEMENYSRTDSLYRLPIGEAMAQISEGYYTQQQGGTAVPAPGNFDTVYLNAAKESEMVARMHSDTMMSDAILETDSLMQREEVILVPGTVPEADAETTAEDLPTDEPGDG